MTSTRERPARFRNETEERAFWETHDSSAHVDWKRATRIRFPNLKPSTKAISLRLPVDLLERIKVAANQRDVPYQSLIKVWLAERVDAMQPRKELSASQRPGRLT